MMDFFLAPFLGNEQMLYGLGAGVLVAVSCGIVGTFVILRGMAFLGDALAHGVLPGVALSMMFGVPGIIGAAVGSAVMIGGIGLINRKTKLSADTAIGLLFVGMVALGVVLVSRSQSYNGDLVATLFGQFLGVSPGDLLVQGIAALILGGVTFIFRRPFLLLCFSPETAQAAGFSARFYQGLMLFMIASTVITAFQTVGTFLVFGMLLAPAAAAALISRRLGTMMALAAGFGIMSVFVGLLVSYHFRLAAGAAVTLAAVAIFFGVLISNSFKKNKGAERG